MLKSRRGVWCCLGYSQCEQLISCRLSNWLWERWRGVGNQPGWGVSCFAEWGLFSPLPLGGPKSKKELIKCGTTDREINAENRNQQTKISWIRAQKTVGICKMGYWTKHFMKNKYGVYFWCANAFTRKSIDRTCSWLEQYYQRCCWIELCQYILILNGDFKHRMDPGK